MYFNAFFIIFNIIIESTHCIVCNMKFLFSNPFLRPGGYAPRSFLRLNSAPAICMSLTFLLYTLYHRHYILYWPWRNNNYDALATPRLAPLRKVGVATPNKMAGWKQDKVLSFLARRIKQICV